jgi:uncharacterized membrane protein
MNAILRTLLDLDTIPDGAGPIRLAWTQSLPPWLWLLAALLAIALGLEAYRRMPGARPLRGALAACRAAAIMLVVVLIAGPLAELPREDVERDRVLVLVDRSRSMSIADATPPPAAAGTIDTNDAGRITRSDQIAAALTLAGDEFATLAEQKDVRWFGFHEGLFALGDAAGAGPEPEGGSATAIDPAASTTVLPALGEAAGVRTDIGRAISQALQRTGGRPVSAVIVATDGRATRPIDPAVARRLRSEGVQLITVPLGAREPIGDLAVGQVDAPSRAFIRDKVPVRLDVDRLGPALVDAGATIRLVDDLSGETLDEQRLEPGDERTALTLVAEPQVAGETTWSIRIEPDEPDLVPENNRLAFAVELIDRPMQVLFVDGYPRWEYRYLKNLLIREQSIESSNFLLTADRDFAQEGNAPITRLPRSVDEWEPYDVIVIGDVPAGFFSPEQTELIRDHVAENGAGLLWIGGERSMPGTYEDTLLADLLPFTGGTRLPAIGRPVTMEPTPLAERLGILQLVLGADRGWPEVLRDPAVGWSQLAWTQRIQPDRLKPTAEALARTVQTVDGSPLPLVVHMRFGAGQSIYVATDEIWRWRYGRGELLPEQFWIQMIRMLARERLAESGEPAILSVEPARTEIGRPVQVRLRILDAQLAESRRGSVVAEVVGGDGEVVTRLELVPEPGDETRYGTTWLPDRSGVFTVRLPEGDLAELDLLATLSVREPADELLQPETDHPLLERLAAETGGRSVAPEDLGAALERLPNREIRTENPLREPIWNTPFAFILLLGLLTLEWVGRRHLRLA